VPEAYRLIYGLNPMVGVIDGFRWALLGGTPPGATLVESVLIALLLLVIGTTVFKRIERNFADVI
jgi:lipopolysaccharide transport system permease protein